MVFYYAPYMFHFKRSSELATIEREVATARRSSRDGTCKDISVILLENGPKVTWHESSSKCQKDSSKCH